MKRERFVDHRRHSKMFHARDARHSQATVIPNTFFFDKSDKPIYCFISIVIPKCRSRFKCGVLTPLRRSKVRSEAPSLACSSHTVQYSTVQWYSTVQYSTYTNQPVIITHSSIITAPTLPAPTHMQYCTVHTRGRRRAMSTTCNKTETTIIFFHRHGVDPVGPMDMSA